MKIAITGITGFLGSRLAPTLSEQGHTIVGLTRSPETASKRLPYCEFVHWPSFDQPIPAGPFNGVDTVIHLAGESVNGRWTRAKRERIMESRRIGTQKVVEAIAATSTPPNHLVSSSAIGIYGDRADTRLTEASDIGNIFLSDVCVAWEDAAKRAAQTGTKVSLLRTGLVLHPDGGALGEMLPLFRKGLGGTLGSGRQYWSWIHLDDWISAACFVLEKKLEGPVNLVGPSPVPQKEFAKTLASVLSRPAFLPAPAFALRAVLGGFASEVLTSKMVIPETLINEGFAFEHPSLREALVQLMGF